MERIAYRIYNPETKAFVFSGSTPSMLADYFRDTATLVTVYGMKHQTTTGIRDKNGIEIYEDDIVSWKMGSIRATGLVNYSGEFPVWLKGNSQYLGSYLKSTEIIGNKHQHPDLLS